MLQAAVYSIWASAPPSIVFQGCGLVTMGTHEEAVAAIDALDNKFTWEGMESPMVVKWMDAALQRRRREQHLAAMRSGIMPAMANWPGGCQIGGMAGVKV